MNANVKPTYEYQGDQLRLSYKPGESEQSRLYTFPGGDTVEIEGVAEARVSRHGHHQLITGAGVKHVVPFGWICLTIQATKDQGPEEYASPR